MIANGYDPILRWDSFSSQAEPAGVIPPSTALTLAGSGAGSIVGVYYGYLRYLDKYGNVSNLSPISAAFAAQGAIGGITDASDTTPIVIGSAAHGLSTSDVVKVTGVGGNTSANNTWTIIVIDADHFSLTGSSSNGTYTGFGIWYSGIDTIIYTGVEAPTDPKIVTRQILRNTDGQTDTFYVDVETSDLTTTTFSSTNSDTTLAANEAQPILDSDGLPLANSNTVPPTHKAVLASHLDRMFAAVQHDYKQGSCKVAFGSTTVTGVGTEWMASLAGRFLYVIGASQSYEIATVDITNQTLTLTESYLDATDPFAVYAIRPAPGEARLVYYSEAGRPESWPAINALAIQEDSDDITGLMAKGSFIYILERRHIYRLTFQDDPAKDGAIFLSSIRGCINHRCWVVVEDVAYMLDEQGCHAFGSAQDSESISEQIQELFRPGSQLSHGINWAASDYFHAIHYRQQQVIRWFITLSGTTLPRHALCYHYRSKRWWIEEYRVPSGAACVGHIKNIPQVFLGSEARRVLAYWQGFLDGPNAADGTVRGTVTGSTITTITDDNAAFADAGLVGSPIAIVAGMGKDQMRKIVKVSGTAITVDQPWIILPDTSSVYQLGAIQWLFQGSWFRFSASEEMAERRVELVFKPCKKPATMDLRINLDFAETAVEWGGTISSRDGDGVSSEEDSKDLTVDLTKSTGVAQKRMPGGKELYADGRRYLQPQLTGYSNDDLIAVYEITIDGVVGNNAGSR